MPGKQVLKFHSPRLGGPVLPGAACSLLLGRVAVNVGYLGNLRSISPVVILSAPSAGAAEGQSFSAQSTLGPAEPGFSAPVGGTSARPADSVCQASCYLHAGVGALPSGTRSAGCPPSLALGTKGP